MGVNLVLAGLIMATVTVAGCESHHGYSYGAAVSYQSDPIGYYPGAYPYFYGYGGYYEHYPRHHYRYWDGHRGGSGFVPHHGHHSNRHWDRGGHPGRHGSWSGGRHFGHGGGGWRR